MGKSGFRIMLYKLRDFARKSPNNPQPGNKKGIKIERTISLPRSGYYHKFAASSSSQREAGQGYESPGGPKHEKNEKIPKNKGKLLHSKSNSMARRNKPQLCSTMIETRVSAGCSYRAAVAPKAKRGLLGKKKKVLKKNLQVIEMAKPGNPECGRSMEILRERNKGIIQQSRKEYSDCAAKVSFDGAVKEERFGFESLRGQAFNSNDNNNNNVERPERCFRGAVKEGGFEPLKVQPVINNNSGRRCSAFCCSCRLSISDTIDELDESSLLDGDIWSEEEEKVEAERLQTPFVRQSDRVVLDMKIDFSEEDLVETRATLSRPSDVAAHAQVQAKLSRMIEEKGSKKKKKNAKPSNITSNGKNLKYFPEFHANDDSDNSTLLPGALNDEEFNEGGERCKARAKIDGQRGSLRRQNSEKCRAAANLASSDGNNKISESVAIVKSSYDPRRDFRESMVEMIMENDIRDAQDLKELLHCYIFLNSEEYHDVILQVFEQVQSDLRIV